MKGLDRMTTEQRPETAASYYFMFSHYERDKTKQKKKTTEREKKTTARWLSPNGTGTDGELLFRSFFEPY